MSQIRSITQTNLYVNFIPLLLTFKRIYLLILILLKLNFGVVI